jgi:hypothetical protein
MMIHELVGDKLDDVVYKLIAKHTSQSKPEVEEIWPYLIVSRPATRQELRLGYSYKLKAHRSEVFSLSRIVEEIIKRGASDMYVSSIAFRFVDAKGVQTDEKRVYFENVAPLKGSDLEGLIKRMRINYLRRYGITTLPQGERIRMLRFAEARTRDDNIIDMSQVNTPSFLGWLTKKTHGLVVKLGEEQVRRVDFAGRSYELGKDSVWARFLEG